MRSLQLLLALLLLVSTPARADGGDADLGPQTGRFFRALEGVKLDATQAAVVDPLREAAAARHAKVREARLALRQAVEQQVRAGALDRASLQALADALAAAVAEAHEGDAAALVTVHGTLKGPQRAKVAQALKEKKQAAPRLQEKGRRLAQELGLSPQQRQELRAALEERLATLEDPERNDFEQRRYDRDEATRRFAGPRFGVGDLPAGEKPAARIERRLTFLEVLVPLLTPEQRDRAAEILAADFGQR